MENLETGTEIDEILAAVAARHVRRTAKRPKKSWQAKRKAALDRSRRHEAKKKVAAYRKAYKASMRGQWNSLRWEMTRRGHVWNLPYDDWAWMWLMAKPARYGQLEVPAWQARGRRKEDVKVVKLERAKPFEINNLAIVQQGRCLWHPE